MQFSGNEYENHTSCISEAEKYQGALYRPPNLVNGSNGKSDPQARWSLTIKKAAAMDNPQLSSCAKDLLIKLSENNNVPRKQGKFINFVSSSYHTYSKNGVLQQVWNFLQQVWIKDVNETKKPVITAKRNEFKETSHLIEDSGCLEILNNAKEPEVSWKKQIRLALKAKNTLRIRDIQKHLHRNNTYLKKKALKEYVLSRPKRFRLKDKMVQLL